VRSLVQVQSPRPFSLMPRTLLVCAALTALLSLRGGPAIATTVAGTIKGAEAVNVRRGPGPDTPAIVSLHRGAKVQVEARVGQWALVVLESGERGYVNAAFVELAPGVTIPAAPPPDAAVDTPPPAATPEPTATGVAAAPPAIDQELAALRERLATLEASVGQPGAAGAHARAEGAAEPPPVVPTMVEPPASLDVGPSLALAGVGLLVGFLFGTLYGQRQERNRRSRVRF
jgi:SH3 domain-containing protein